MRRGIGIGLQTRRSKIIFRNLLRSTEDFSSVWAGSLVITTNTTAAPNGTTTADTLEDASAAVTNSINQGVTIEAGTDDYTFSLHVDRDADTSRFPEFNVQYFNGGTSTHYSVQINTSTGATSIRLGTPTVAVEDLGDYWRLKMTCPATAGNTTLRCRIYAAISDVIGGTNAAKTGSLIAWGAQLEKAAAMTDYQKRA